jgi:hypothetical protein
MSRLSRAVIALTFSLAVVAGCSGPNPFQAAKESTTTTASSTADQDVTGNSLADNVYLPNRNLSDCVGTLERPDCGSPQKGGKGMYMTFAVLILGLGFVMWRIALSVRKRDAVVNATDDAPHPGTY